VGAGVGGLAAALEAVAAGVDPEAITVIEARTSTALQRNIVVDRFMLDRLRAFGAVPTSLNPWDTLALSFGEAPFDVPILLPALSRLRPGPRDAAPSVDVLMRIPAGVAQLAELNDTMRHAALRQGVRLLTGTRVVAVESVAVESVAVGSVAGEGRVLRLEGPGGAADLTAEMVVLACGASSPLLDQLGVRRESVDIGLQSWLIAVIDRVGRNPVALRLVDLGADGSGMSMSLSSRHQTSITLRLPDGAHVRAGEIKELSRRAALDMKVPGEVVEAIVYETRMDRATTSRVGPDCVLLGDALRRSDVTYGGGANSAFTDAWWFGRLLAGTLGIEGYSDAVDRTTEELVRGGWIMRMIDGLQQFGQRGRRMWPAPARTMGDLTLSVMTQGWANVVTAWTRLLPR